MQRPPIVQFGAAPAGASSADQAREIMARFLETFPTFKYDSTKGKDRQGGSDGQGPADEGAEGLQPGGNEGDEVDPGDDEPVCSICLGNFVSRPGAVCLLSLAPCLWRAKKPETWNAVSGTRKTVAACVINDELPSHPSHCGAGYPRIITTRQQIARWSDVGLPRRSMARSVACCRACMFSTKPVSTTGSGKETVKLASGACVAGVPPQDV